MRNYETEVTIKTSRSGGKGGQNVNKVETKVELMWNPANSGLFTEVEKGLLLEKLATKLDSEGYLHITAQVKRSQLENKEVAFKKLHDLVEKSLIVKTVRQKTKVPKSVINAIKKEKIARSEKKANRRGDNWDE